MDESIFNPSGSALMDDIFINVIGIGGGGINALNYMAEQGLPEGATFAAVDTDMAALNKAKADIKVHLSNTAAKNAAEEILPVLKGCHMVFLLVGMGGETGTAAASVIAEAAQAMGILTTAVVTTPFAFEGKAHSAAAQKGIDLLLKKADSVIVIPNERLKLISEEKITIGEAFTASNELMYRGVKSVVNSVCATGYINLGFADFYPVFKGTGYAQIYTGSGIGANKAADAVKAAVSCPLAEKSLKKARAIFLNIETSPDIFMEDIESVINQICEISRLEACLIYGHSFNDDLSDTMVLTVIASDFEEE